MINVSPYTLCKLKKGNPVTENEQKALALRRDPQALEKHLRSVVRLLNVQHRRSFGEGTFNFEKATLTGDDGSVLQWHLRAYPHLPESYENQQTTIGRTSYDESPVCKWGGLLKSAVQNRNMVILERVAGSLKYKQLREVAKAMNVDLDDLEELLGEL